MATYIAQGRINHDNKIYEKGQEIELNEKQAKALLAMKLLKKSGKKNSDK